MKKNKISGVLRASLLQLVLQERQTIKQAAGSLGINYSSAKSIINSFRKRSRGELLLSASE
jgi:hypothetical protein